jgi:hypothetical protein
MKKLIKSLVAILAALSALACTPESSAPSQTTDFKISGVSIPATVSASTGEEIIFKVYAQGPLATDLLVFVTDSGVEIKVPLSTCQGQEFGFIVPEGMFSDTYTMYVEREGQRIKVGKLTINISLTVNIALKETTTVYGLILCDGRPVKDVVVSDGYDVTKTDENGIYQLASEKKHNYVFISIPSGYTVKLSGSQPVFFQHLVNGPNVKERVDFTLYEDTDQTKHTMVIMGDIHLAARNNDLNQFQNFVNDLNTYMSSNTSVKFYGLTLGDLAWDQYWIPNGYDLNHYMKDIAKVNAPVFNTIGNHDHEQAAAGDFSTVALYKKIVCPTYYSFNIGKVHYVSIDDIECTNNGTGSRTYNTKVVNEVLDWLAKDIAMIGKDTPVVISMHSPVYNETGTNRLTNSQTMLSILDGRMTHIMSGHTHIMYNVEKDDHFEHNAGSVCATWWWTGKETPGIHMSTDGTPGGYLLFNVDGTEFSWQFKATGKPLSHQFRTFDRNEIHITADKYVPSASEQFAADFIALAGEYAKPSTANEVLINVWDYDPQWKVEVTENGTPLTVTKVTAKDPLHMIAYPAKRWNAGKEPTFNTGNTTHFFKVKASAPNTTLSIKVTDRFGNVYTEEMTRPKAFTIDNYK